MPQSTGVACAFTISNKKSYVCFVKKYNKHEKLYNKVQQTRIFFDEIDRKSLQKFMIEK